MKSSLCLLLVLAGCAVSRPAGAFGRSEPEPPDDAPPTGFTDGDAGAKGDGSVKIPRRDAGFTASSSSPLAAYTGSYLMRMDMFSTAEPSALTAALQLKNRVSNLLLADVQLDGDTLVIQETLCHQTFAHVCTGCTGGWTTTPDQNLAKFFPRASSARTLSVTDGQLVGELAVLAVGFDATNVNESTRIPRTVNDDRLWKLAPSDPTRVGLRTRLQTRVSVAKLDCVVTAAELFGSSFEGTSGEDATSPLEGVEFALQTPTVEQVSLDVVGEPSIYCNQDVLGMQAAPKPGPQYVRFRRTDSADSCPSVAVFDGELPPEPP